MVVVVVEINHYSILFNSLCNDTSVDLAASWYEYHFFDYKSTGPGAKKHKCI